MYHALSRMIRAVLTPLVQLAAAILVKRVLGFNRPGPSTRVSEQTLLRRYINGVLLSQENLKRVFLILGTHYEAVSVIYRWMGAKVGERVYWPGSGIYCPDPELLEIGDDVVFGSRSEMFTTDCLGTERIVIRNGGWSVHRRVVALVSPMIYLHSDDC